MEHDGREKTYAKLIQKFIHILVCASTEMRKKKVACLELELIKGEDGDDKAKWEHRFSFYSLSVSCAVCSKKSVCVSILSRTGRAWCPQQRGWCDILSASKGTRALACRTSSPPFHSFPLSISCHLFLSCTKPDEGHLTNVPIAMQKSNILAAPWPVNISTKPTGSPSAPCNTYECCWQNHKIRLKSHSIRPQWGRT